MPVLAASDYADLVAAIAAQVAAGPAPALSAAVVTPVEPAATAAEIDALCRRAVASNLVVVCVHPCWLARAVALLRATPVAVATVIGYPTGMTLSSVKIAEAAECLKLGADELHLVLNPGQPECATAELVAIRALAEAAGAGLKLIPALSR